MPNRYHYNPADSTTYPNGAKIFRTYAPFCSIARAENVPCADGKRRTIHIGAAADTFFSVPAFTYARGRTVTGFLSFASGAWVAENEGPIFSATGKHADLIGRWKADADQKPRMGF